MHVRCQRQVVTVHEQRALTSKPLVTLAARFEQPWLNSSSVAQSDSPLLNRAGLSNVASSGRATDHQRRPSEPGANAHSTASSRNKKRPARVERGRALPTEGAFALRFVGRSRCAAAQVAGLWGSWRYRWGEGGHFATHSAASGRRIEQDLAIHGPPEGGEGGLPRQNGTEQQGVGTPAPHERVGVVVCLRLGHAATWGGARALVG